jgi:hypothetical protein
MFHQYYNFRRRKEARLAISVSLVAGEKKAPLDGSGRLGCLEDIWPLHGVAVALLP